MRRLLLVDDNSDDRLLVRRELSKVLPSAQVDEAGEESEFRALLGDRSASWDVAVTDYQLRWSTGLAVFRALRERQPDLPVILFTASGTEELAVEALREGVADYITKSPRHYARVPYAVLASAEHRQRAQDAAEALQALRRHEAQLQLAMDAGGMEAWEWNPQDSMLTFEGRLQGPFAGCGGGVTLSDFLQRVPPDDRPAVLEAWRRAPESSRLDVDLQLKWPGHDVRWIHMSATDGGEAFGGRWIGVAYDVTAIKQLERDLRRTDQQKNEFIGVLAHELRNPLAPLANAAYLLSASPTAERLSWIRDVISRQVAVMKRLLDDLLDLSRLDIGKVTLERRRIDLRTALDDAIADCGAALAGRRLNLQHSTPDEPLWVDADPVRLQEMLDNLFDNAIKFTPDGGTLSAALRSDGNEAVFALQDTGIGIEADMLDRIFEPFVQSRASPMQPNRGLGIGLALVRRLAAAHGGSIVARSAGLGSGAAFELRLPRTGQPEAGAPAHGGSVVQARGTRIVVADDEPDVAATLSAVLTHEGFVVSTAGDAAAAIERIEEARPAALVLDLGMPHGGGIAVARWVRQQSWGRDILIAAVSGWGRDEDRAKTRDAGFDIHLTKPVDTTSLLRAIDEGLQARQTGRERDRPPHRTLGGG